MRDLRRIQDRTDPFAACTSRARERSDDLAVFLDILGCCTTQCRCVDHKVSDGLGHLPGKPVADLSLRWSALEVFDKLPNSQLRRGRLSASITAVACRWDAPRAENRRSAFSRQAAR